jgi:hypothetical protein
LASAGEVIVAFAVRERHVEQGVRTNAEATMSVSSSKANTITRRAILAGWGGTALLATGAGTRSSFAP